MWKRRATGRILTFHLAGINNQNFIMRDQETGSFWQQVSGKCISGPLKGQALELVRSDELTFALWRQEAPTGTILAPDPKFADKYERANWEQQVAKLPTVVKLHDDSLAPRTLIAGFTVEGISKAYPLSAIAEGVPIQDQFGGTPLLLALGPDGKSLRAFMRRIPGESQEPDFYKKNDNDWMLMDSVTSSLWDFRGCAFQGPAKGKCLEPVYVLKDYWFDWHTYHPDTLLYRH